MSDTMIDRLNQQLERLQRHPFYSGRLPTRIASLEEFSQQVPLLSRSAVVEESSKPQGGAFAHGPPPVRIHVTNMGTAQVPILFSRTDLDSIMAACGKHLQACELGPGDVCMVTFGYHLFVAGLFYQTQMERQGIACIPHGPGETERAVRIARQCGVNVLASNPTHALRLMAAGFPVPKVFFAGGEPFTSDPELWARVQEAMPGALLIDSFSLSEFLPVARTFPGGAGLHVFDELVHAEVIDPETGEPVADGERGELVLTHLARELQPLMRYRTGDLTVKTTTDPVHGRTVSLPQSVLGRVDNMVKVKGVKLYPSQIGPLLRGVGELSGRYQLLLSRPDGHTDRLELIAEGRASAAELDGVGQRFRATTGIAADSIRASERLDGDQTVLDQRH